MQRPAGFSADRRSCQRDFLHFHDIVRKRISELAVLGRVGVDRPYHELVLGHCLYILMHPGGDAARHIGVAALQNHTYSHNIYSKLWTYLLILIVISGDAAFTR